MGPHSSPDHLILAKRLFGVDAIRDLLLTSTPESTWLSSPPTASVFGLGLAAVLLGIQFF